MHPARLIRAGGPGSKSQQSSRENFDFLITLVRAGGSASNALLMYSLLVKNDYVDIKDVGVKTAMQVIHSLVEQKLTAGTIPPLQFSIEELARGLVTVKKKLPLAPLILDLYRAERSFRFAIIYDMGTKKFAPLELRPLVENFDWPC